MSGLKRYEQGTLGMQPDKEGAWCEYSDAKTEIEQLTKELKACRLVNHAVIGEQKAEIERLRNALEISCGARELANQEIERLRDQLQIRAGHVLDLEQTVKQREAEIERLQAAHDHQYAMAGTLLREAERYGRENEELRGLLNECCEYAIPHALYTRIAKILGLGGV